MKKFTVLDIIYLSIVLLIAFLYVKNLPGASWITGIAVSTFVGLAVVGSLLIRKEKSFMTDDDQSRSSLGIFLRLVCGIFVTLLMLVAVYSIDGIDSNYKSTISFIMVSTGAFWYFIGYLKCHYSYKEGDGEKNESTRERDVEV